MGKSTISMVILIAMLNYQRVIQKTMSRHMPNRRRRENVPMFSTSGRAFTVQSGSKATLSVSKTNQPLTMILSINCQQLTINHCINHYINHIMVDIMVDIMINS